MKVVYWSKIGSGEENYFSETYPQFYCVECEAGYEIYYISKQGDEGKFLDKWSHRLKPRELHTYYCEYHADVFIEDSKHERVIYEKLSKEIDAIDLRWSPKIESWDPSKYDYKSLDKDEYTKFDLIEVEYHRNTLFIIPHVKTHNTGDKIKVTVDRDSPHHIYEAEIVGIGVLRKGKVYINYHFIKRY